LTTRAKGPSSGFRAAVLVVLAAGPLVAAGAEEDEPSLKYIGDFRLLLNGIDDASDEGSLRARAGIDWAVSPGFHAVIRGATSASTSGNEWRVGSFPSAQTSAGLAPGSVTLDLAHLRYEPASGLRLRIGRFQETLALPAIPDKSLDRKDSDGTGISYSDGISAEYPVGHGWSLLGIAQYQPDGGATNRPREPLTFDDDAKPVSGYFALKKSDETGPWALASLSYSLYPDSLAEDGRRENYSGLVANAMRRIPVEGVGKLLIGGSLGYAPDIPQPVPSASQAHAAWQVTANLVDFGPRDQGFGVVYMRTGAGWLLSPDLANGKWLAEARYRFRPVPRLTVEMRLRYRRDTEDPVTGAARETDRDWYLRLTWQ
jgi:hypothetical protein